VKRRGFTLIECIVALLVTAMIGILIQFTLKLYMNVDQQPYDDYAQWYIFIQELESKDNQFELANGGNDNAINLYSRVRTKQYTIEQNAYKPKVYMYGTESGAGYLPLLQHVKKYSVIHQNGNPRVIFKVEFLSGEKHEAEVTFPIYVKSGD